MAQIGLSVGLIVIGLMLAKDFSRLAKVDIGYQAEGVLSAQVALSGIRHSDGGRQFFDKLLSRLCDLPGVEAAALVFPALGTPQAGVLTGRVKGYGDEFLQWRVVSPSLFSLLRVPILAGRALTEADGRGAEPVVVVNNTFAERYWGSAKAAIGREITFVTPMTVVGVVRDMANPSIRTTPEVFVTYTRAAQSQILPPEMSLLVRGREGDLAGLGVRVARLAQEVDPYQPLYNVRGLKDLARASLARTRLLLILVGVFSALATLLAAVGVYVVLAFAVTRRTNEFGIRLALGATRREVLRLVLGRTFRVVAKGVVLTVPLTFSAIWLFAAQVFGVTETDPMTCVWAVGLVAAAALVASAVPAWRATRVDPTIALREE